LRGYSDLPSTYEIPYICYLLGVTYTDLMSQPRDWIQRMLDILRAKTEIEKIETKKAEQRNKTRAR